MILPFQLRKPQPDPFTYTKLLTGLGGAATGIFGGVLASRIPGLSRIAKLKLVARSALASGATGAWKTAPVGGLIDIARHSLR